MNIHATPYKSFPLRLHPDIALELDRIASETHIPKTKIITIGLEKFLMELDESGVASAVKSACEI